MIGLDTVKQVAHLSRLELTADEELRFTEQLGAILSHVEALQSVSTEGVAPTHHPLPLPNVLRPDAARDSLTREDVLAGAPAAEQGMFRVPRILAE
ncbi:MAG: Asp-tRNA(Asn)/Glu-tRNA(Gln) amidotransferase subunit GatC [bacterium]|nr:Asp-tRNA(Asn)/Glu-tRNA(Gln) amidotransferase subunit GatC [bacterium]